MEDNFWKAGFVTWLILKGMLQAAERGDTGRVRQLLEADSTLANAKGAHNKTPLHRAAEKNHVEIAELLISAGANINAEDSWSMTPLQWATNMGSRNVAKILLARAAQSKNYAADKLPETRSFERP